MGGIAHGHVTVYPLQELQAEKNLVVSLNFAAAILRCSAHGGVCLLAKAGGQSRPRSRPGKCPINPLPQKWGTTLSATGNPQPPGAVAARLLRSRHPNDLCCRKKGAVWAGNAVGLDQGRGGYNAPTLFWSGMVSWPGRFSAGLGEYPRH